MIRRVKIENNWIDVDEWEIGYTDRNVETIIINKKYYLNKARRDVVESECENCNKIFTIYYYTAKSYESLCTSCKISSVSKSKNIVNKNQEVYIRDNNNVFFCSLLYKKRAALIVDQHIYVVSGMKLNKVCSNCGKTFIVNFSSFDNYHDECSTCIRELTSLKKYGVRNNFQSPQTKKTLIEKYEVDSVNKIPEVKEKKKKIMMKKYGNENPWSFGTDRFKQLMIDRYGVDNALKNENIKNIVSKKIIKYRSSKEFRESLGEYILEKFKNSSLVEAAFTKEEYINVQTPTRWKCKRCNEYFESAINWNITPRCPTCFPKIINSSFLEKEISSWLKSLNIKIIENTKSIISPWELDIYIPSYNLAIEFNGLYWHSESQGKDKSYHLNKTNRCLKKGIQLLHVWENEWIEKQDIVKSIIKSKLGFYDFVIHGRKCFVKEISNEIASVFYFENHMQGSVNSSINLGLYHSDELISCLSFSKSRFNKKYDWEITRFANKLGYKIHGGFSKLWSHKPEGSIITYSDKRLFTGEVYKKYMRQCFDSRPSYWYFKDLKLHSRLEFQKHKLSRFEEYDESLTEWENMQMNGYDRIWDCGNHVFVYE